MEIFFRFAAFGFVVFSMLNTGCSPPNVHSFENGSHGTLSPTPEKFTPGDNRRIIKETGWQVPSTKDTRVGGQAIEIIKSVDGKDIKVKTTSFTPKDKFVYEEEPPYGTETRAKGALELIHFQEFNLKGKIYLYALTVQKFMDKSQTNNNAIHEEMFVYQILDNDGDGKFETLIDGTSDVLIPKWITE